MVAVRVETEVEATHVETSNGAGESLKVVFQLRRIGVVRAPAHPGDQTFQFTPELIKLALVHGRAPFASEPAMHSATAYRRRAIKITARTGSTSSGRTPRKHVTQELPRYQ